MSAPAPQPDEFDFDLGRFCRRHSLKGIEVAKILGYSTGHISRCINGRRDLSANAWRVLRRFAGEEGA